MIFLTGEDWEIYQNIIPNMNRKWPYFKGSVLTAHRNSNRIGSKCRLNDLHTNECGKDDLRNMQTTGLNELRENFLSYFESKDHLRMHSFPLIPKNDKSLLLINSGMAPLKPYFTGMVEPPNKRVTSCQKCIRTPDIENVGKTARHGTFFEMLGNFSFGDYFKEEAIAWSWEYVTKVLSLPTDKLYVSIYLDDDEAFDIWHNQVGVPEERIVRLGKEDNFWEHGLGPCGPCSEIYFDRGPEKGCGSPDCAVGCNSDRYIEFWNLVFTQFDKKEDGRYEKLAHPNIDTGMGLERLACILQGVDNLFEVDTIRSILDKISEIAQVSYGKHPEKDISLRVITDHIRSTVMMVCDGVIPSNEGRGYVLRRLLRRAARHGRLLGVEGRFLDKLSETVVATSGNAYPELVEKAGYIRKVIMIEEERFAATLDQGLLIFKDYLEKIKSEEKTVMGGEMVFKLHDTYGFPLDLTREIAEEEGMRIDEEGFRVKMAQQRKKAKDALKDKDGSAWGTEELAGIDQSAVTEFLGYEQSTVQATVLAVIPLDTEGSELVGEGDRVAVVLDRTPFYAESGGQQTDTGRLFSRDCEVEITDCKKTESGIWIHNGVIQSGTLSKGDLVTAEIDVPRRFSTAKNHTATHLLHEALRRVLGEHVGQAGSLVGQDRLRFDFTHFESVKPEELAKIEQIVNEHIFMGSPVTVCEMSLEDARKTGAQALFGEKYGDRVRVVGVEGFSNELCGGTHVGNTLEIGMFLLLSEGGIASGIRRIEALTGAFAFNHLKNSEKILAQASGLLKASPQDVPQRIESLQREFREREREISKMTARMISGIVDEAVGQAKQVGPVRLIVKRMDQLDMEGLREMADRVKEKISPCVVVIGSGKDGKVNFVAAADQEAVTSGVHSGNIIKKVAAETGGGGGGRPDLAQAGGKDQTAIDRALNMVEDLVKTQLKMS